MLLRRLWLLGSFGLGLRRFIGRRWQGSQFGRDFSAKRTFKLPAAKYDLLLEDCNQDTIAEEHDLDGSKDTTYTVR